MNTTLRRARRLALLALSAFSLGCSDDPNGPSGIEGTYALTRIADRAMPTAVFDGTYYDDDGDPHDMLIRATAGHLTLTHGGTRYVHRVDLISWVDDSPSIVSDIDDHGYCERAGAVLVCESNYLENVAFTAQVAGNDLTIVQDLSGEAEPLPYLYRR